jgi:hypothetical protein
MPEPDLSQFRAAVQFRDKCREAAMAGHRRAGLAPSIGYANSTYDAIVDLIRADERTRAEPAAPSDEVVSVAVRQLNNGTQTLVLFAVPFAAERRHAEQHDREMTFDEASAAALGPPLVITKSDFDQ